MLKHSANNLKAELNEIQEVPKHYYDPEVHLEDCFDPFFYKKVGFVE